MVAAVAVGNTKQVERSDAQKWGTGHRTPEELGVKVRPNEPF